MELRDCPCRQQVVATKKKTVSSNGLMKNSKIRIAFVRFKMLGI
jgi:hypothetical protein